MMASIVPRLQLQLSPTPPKPRTPQINISLNENKKPFPCPPDPEPEPNPGLAFREKVLYLERDLRIDPYRALSLNPSLRSAPLSSIVSVVDFLSSYGVDDSARVLQMYPDLLTCDPDSDLRPVLDFLLDPVGIPFPDLRKSVARCPRLLVSSVPLQLRPALYFLRRLGFVGPHRISPHTTLLLVSDVERTLIPKLDFIRSLGFSYGETARMVLRSPGLLTFSIHNNLKPKAEFLTGEMGRDVEELKGFPQYFSFSLEGKIKPRHRALLEAGLQMPLPDMLKVSDGHFRVRLLEMRLKAAEEEEEVL